MTIRMLVLKYFVPKMTKFHYLDFFKVSVIFKVKMETLGYTQIFFCYWRNIWNKTSTRLQNLHSNIY